MDHPSPPAPWAADAAGRAVLRDALRAARRALPVRERLDAAAGVATQLLPALGAHAGPVAGYWAVGGELPLHAVQSALPADLQWHLPVLHDDQRLRFRAWAPGQPLVANAHGIPEPGEGPLLAPEAMTVVLVPLLGFDARGHRLGQGGGWYDRSFAFRLPSPGKAPEAGLQRPRLIGIAYDQQQVDALEAAEWDVPLDAVATPTAFHTFDHALA